jgi:hypothetical protein
MPGHTSTGDAHVFVGDALFILLPDGIHVDMRQLTVILVRRHSA